VQNFLANVDKNGNIENPSGNSSRVGIISTPEQQTRHAPAMTIVQPHSPQQDVPQPVSVFFSFTWMTQVNSHVWLCCR